MLEIASSISSTLIVWLLAPLVWKLSAEGFSEGSGTGFSEGSGTGGSTSIVTLPVLFASGTSSSASSNSHSSSLLASSMLY